MGSPNESIKGSPFEYIPAIDTIRLDLNKEDIITQIEEITVASLNEKKETKKRKTSNGKQPRQKRIKKSKTIGAL